MTSDPISIVLRFLQALVVLVLMLAFTLFMYFLSNFKGQLYTAWLIAEILWSAILVVIFIESIFLCAYKLQPYEPSLFQAVKTVLWLLVMVVGVIELATIRPEDRPVLVGDWVAGSILVL